jgi:hypothetical protein
MNGIYFKDGAYVLVDNDEINDICLYHPLYRIKISLYGGRVHISRYEPSWMDYSILTIDGISIFNMKYAQMQEYLSHQTIISHLNSIETYGIDAFIENYKKSVEFLYSEVKNMHNIAEARLSLSLNENQTTTILYELERIRTSLFAILALLFSLYSNMKTGLENDKVQLVYQSIKDIIA